MSIPEAAAIVVVFLLVFGVVAALTILKKLELEPRKKKMLVNAILVSVIARIMISAFGHNYDVSSYCIVSNILEQGKSVYAHTDRYNYGPIWAWLVSGFGHLASCNTGEGFHILIAVFLSIIDVMIGVILAESYSWIAAMVFLLSPISLLISGFHSQFDNLAILLSLLAWLMIRAGKPKLSVLVGSSALLGISLVTKHVMFFFPIWLVFWKPLGKLRYRALYAGLAYGIFGASFLPWWADPSSRAGILKNVFSYKSFYGDSLVGRLIGLFAPVESFDALFFHCFHLHNGLQMLWMGFMLATGIVLAAKDKRELFLLYLMTLYVSSPSMAWQYTVIPMIAAAVYYGLWESLAFIVAGTIALLLTATNICSILFCYLVLTAIGKLDPQHFAAFLIPLELHYGHIFLDSSQLCVGAMLVNRWCDLKTPNTVLSKRGKLIRAAVLIAAGCLPMILTLAK